jgi:predicted tellurium resistance membrane protein TerC
MENLFTFENLLALIFLTIMEIVLGIDNVVFISIATGKLPAEQQRRARFIGLALAMGVRIALLLAIKWIIGLTTPVFHLDALGIGKEWLHRYHHVNDVTWRDLIMLAGGLFLIRSAVREIHHKMEGEEEHGETAPRASSFRAVVTQIVLLDIIFSLDSVLTAVGMAKNIWVMIAAVIVSVGVMMVAASSVSNFIDRHPTTKMLALAFLLLIGVMLTVEGLGQEIPKGYIYFGMFFSLMVELLNLRASRKRQKLAHAQDHKPSISPHAMES